jgi:chitin disaccharide deacetylase
MSEGATHKFLIITADDFGLDSAVNRAVAQAAKDGVLTTASLMVGAPAAEEAVRIARTLPTLKVGLHLVLTDGWPALPPQEIPDLVESDGRFADSMVSDSFRYCISNRMRAQLRAEIRAQFEAFAASGLKLDHVNTHKHFHLHPLLLQEILRIGREFGMTAMRVPEEPLWFSGRYSLASWLSSPFLTPWLALMRRRLREERITCNDRVFGVACSGGLDETAMLTILEQLPDGVTEIYMHPAVQTQLPLTSSMSHYRHSDELEALLSPRVRDAVTSTKATCGGYSDLTNGSLQLLAQASRPTQAPPHRNNY